MKEPLSSAAEGLATYLANQMILVDGELVDEVVES